MHMADALVAPAVAAVMYAASGATATYSVRKVKLEQNIKKIPIMGVMGAFVFAAQMINFTIPGTGSSGHLSGAMLLSVILGPYAAFLTMIAILLVQSLMFADGGLLALGCNIWNMAFYACFIGYLCVYKPILRNKHSRIKIITASILGCILSLQLGSLSVTIQTLASGISELPFSTFLLTMQPIHLAIGIVEGVITSVVLIFIYETRRELIDQQSTYNRLSIKKMMAILILIVALIGGGLSIVASSNPDGLEWSIEKVMGNGELKAEGSVYDTASSVQEKTAILTDYGFENSDSKYGTTFSGLIGSLVVAVICIGCGLVIKIIKKQKKRKPE